MLGGDARCGWTVAALGKAWTPAGQGLLPVPGECTRVSGQSG